MISLVVCTYRPGGLDLLAESLTRTRPSEFVDYELVVIDDCPGRVQRVEAARYLASKAPLGYYGHSKPKSYPDTKGGLCNAYNTALMHCRGDFTVWLSDFTLLPDYWLMQWGFFLQLHGNGQWMMSGSAVEYLAPKPSAPGDIWTWPEPVSMFAVNGSPVLPAKKTWVPEEFETFYYGVSMGFFEAINGVDERADHCHCWPLSSTVAQARMMGYELKVNQELACFMVDHRLWDDEGEPAPPGCGGEGMWRITHAQSVPEEPVWQVPSPNPFDLRTVRRANGVGGKP